MLLLLTDDSLAGLKGNAVGNIPKEASAGIQLLGEVRIYSSSVKTSASNVLQTDLTSTDLRFILASDWKITLLALGMAGSCRNYNFLEEEHGNLSIIISNTCMARDPEACDSDRTKIALGKLLPQDIEDKQHFSRQNLITCVFTLVSSPARLLWCPKSRFFLSFIIMN